MAKAFSTASSRVPDLGEMFQMARHLAFVPAQQDRLHVREVRATRPLRSGNGGTGVLSPNQARGSGSRQRRARTSAAGGPRYCGVTLVVVVTCSDGAPVVLARRVTFVFVCVV